MTGSLALASVPEGWTEGADVVVDSETVSLDAATPDLNSITIRGGGILRKLGRLSSCEDGGD